MAKANTPADKPEKAVVAKDAPPAKAAPGQAAPAGGPRPAVANALSPAAITTEPLIWPLVPDQTSYAGRNYMDMALTSNKFVPQISVDRNGNIITPQNAPAGIFAAGVQGKPSAVVAMANPIMRSTTIVTPVDPSGAPTSPSRAAPGMASSKPAAGAKLKPITEPSGFSVMFDTPTAGQIIQATGTSVEITVSLVVNPADNVQSAATSTCAVRFDGKTAVPLTQSNPDTNGSVTFTSKAPLTVGSGSHTLSATATQKQNSSSAQIEFVVQLTTAGGGGVVAVPTLTIVSPLDGTVIAAQFGDPNSPPEAVVSFTGAAIPPAGATIKSVQVQVGSDAATASSATPDPTAGWSKWSADQVLVGYGPQAATVTLVDSNGSTVLQTITLILAPFEPRLWLYSKLLIIEDVRLTNYAGRCGRGKVLRTLSLLPGETTNISVSSYSTSETTTTDTTSIFDELNDSTSSDFDSSISDEQTDKQSHQDSQAWGIAAKASASWGWGNAEISGTYKSDSNSAREDLRKSVSAATQKHAAQRSSRRTVQVNAENQQTITSGTTQSIQRQISNINVSCTLNFIFYQLNQEYISLLHLVDVRIGYVSAFLSLVDGTTKFDYQEVTLSDLPALLAKAIKTDYQVEVSGHIDDVLNNVVDYGDVLHSVTETVTPTDEVTKAPVPQAQYFRFRRGLSGSWVDQTTGTTYVVSGVLIGVDKVTMRTDGVLVDSALGQNPAIDNYNVGLQQASLAQRQIANASAQQVIDLVNNPDAAKTDAWQKTHPQNLPASLTIAASNPAAQGGP
jgi:hypothetical protein